LNQALFFWSRAENILMPLKERAPKNYTKNTPSRKVKKNICNSRMEEKCFTTPLPKKDNPSVSCPRPLTMNFP